MTLVNYQDAFKLPTTEKEENVIEDDGEHDYML